MISVILSTYNNQKFLKSSLESILNQTYKNFEFIIINDCSTDETSKILEYYQSQDNRIKVYRNEKNLGLTKSLNIGLKRSIGSFIARMDDDDISINTRFENQIKEFDLNPKLMVVGGSIKKINENGEFINNKLVNFSSNFSDTKFISNFLNPLSHPTVMIRKEIINLVGLYNENYRLSQDYDLWKRVIKNNYTIYSIKKHLLNYRVHNNSVSVKNSTHQNLNFLTIKYDYDNEDNFTIFDRIESKILNSPLNQNENNLLFQEFVKALSSSEVFKEKDYILYLGNKKLTFSKKRIKVIFSSKKISPYTKTFLLMKISKNLFLKKNFYLFFYCCFLSFRVSFFSILKIIYYRFQLND